jgi:hypothetical protein
MEVRIRNERELLEWEARIGSVLARHDLDYVLGGIRQSLDKLEPFTAAGIALFAIRYSLPPIARGTKLYEMPWGELAPIAHLVIQYLIADPVSFEPAVEDDYRNSTLIPIILRTVGNQFPYNVPFFGQYARSLMLFHHIPRQMRGRAGKPDFDFDTAFQSITGVSLVDFIDVGYAAFAAANGNHGFTGGWFQKAKDQGLNIDDGVVTKVLDQLAADQWQLRELYESYRQPERRYGMYDFNPLFVYPLVRPWPKRDHTTLDEDRMIAPLPQLILTRLSEGIYQQMFHRHRDDFSQYFGRLHEAYVGEILRHSVPSKTLLSEDDIRSTYKKGKVPDWVIIDGDTAILVESKATGFQRKALATADSDAIDRSVSQVRVGLIQLHEFRDACERRVAGLEMLHGCSDFKLLVVTFEPFYIVNSVPFRVAIDGELSKELAAKGVSVYPWYVLAVDQLEKLQPHIAAGVELKDAVEKLIGHKSFDSLLKEISDQTGRSYRDCFLYEMDIEIYKRLNIPIEDDDEDS